MKLTRKVSGIIAGGGAVALVAGAIAYSGGVGAAFTDKAVATASIDVGDFRCEITNPNDDSRITDINNSGATSNVKIALGQVDASSGSTAVNLGIKNTGDVPMTIVWSAKVSGAFFLGGDRTNPIPVTTYQNFDLGVEETGIYSLGAEWFDLGNGSLNSDGQIVYTADCIEQTAATYPIFVSTKGSGSVSWTADSELALTVGAQSGAINAYVTGIDVTETLDSLSNEPAISVDHQILGMPKWVITLDDNTVLGGNVGLASAGRWQVNPGSTVPADVTVVGQNVRWPGAVGNTWSWSQVVDYYGDRTIKSAELVSWKEGTTTIDCASIGSINFVGSGGACSWS